MAIILSIETSTPVCSVALHQDGQLVSIARYFLEKSHSTILNPLIEETLANSGMTMSDLSAVAISQGPGSYTGLRIGTSTAKGICYGLDIPLIAVDTLLSMCQEVNRFNVDEMLLCPMLDARRMEVYDLVANHQLEVIKEVNPTIVEPGSYDELLAENNVLFFGNGSDKCREILGKSNNAFFISDIHPSAEFVGALAWQHYEASKFEDVAYFEPFYLKAFKAGKPKQLV